MKWENMTWTCQTPGTRERDLAALRAADLDPSGVAPTGPGVLSCFVPSNALRAFQGSEALRKPPVQDQGSWSPSRGH